MVYFLLTYKAAESHLLKVVTPCVTSKGSLYHPGSTVPNPLPCPRLFFFNLEAFLSSV